MIQLSASASTKGHGLSTQKRAFSTYSDGNNGSQLHVIVDHCQTSLSSSSLGSHLRSAKWKIAAKHCVWRHTELKVACHISDEAERLIGNVFVRYYEKIASASTRSGAESDE